MATITANISASAGLIPLSEPVDVGYYIIDSENIFVTGMSRGADGRSFDRLSASVNRGVGGTTPATHLEDATLTRYYPDAAASVTSGDEVITTIPAVLRVSGVIDDLPTQPMQIGPANANFDVGRPGSFSITRTVFDNAQIYFMSNDDIIYMANDNGDTIMYTKYNGLTQLRPVVIQTAAPADADISNSTVALWFDATNGSAKIKFKGKSANGTVVVGEVALT